MGLFGPPDVTKLEEKGNVKKLVSLLSHEDYGLKFKASCALIRMGESAVPTLVNAMAGDPHGFLVYQMQTILPRIGYPAVKPLGDLLKSSGPGVQKNVIRVLKDFLEPAAIPYLLKGTKAQDALTARWALEGLQQNNNASIIGPLLKRLNKKSELLPEIAITIGCTGNPEVFQPLLDLLCANTEEALTSNHANSLVEGIIRGLGRLGDPQAVDIIRQVQEPESNAENKYRWDHLTLMPAKIDAMYWIGSPRAIDALTSLEIKTRHHQPWVADSSGRILFRRYESSAFEKLLLLGMHPANTDLVRMRLLALESHGAIEELLLNLASASSVDECVDTAEKLLQLDHASLVNPMIKLFEHPDPGIRSAASAILGRIGRAASSKNILSPVFIAYRDSRSTLIRKHAADVMGIIRAKRWIDTLKLDMLSEKDPETLRAIQAAVSKTEGQEM